MVIDAGICRLRPWSEDDIEAAARIANDAEVSRYMHSHFPYPYTVDDARVWIERQRDFGPAMQFAIDVDGQLAGGIGLEPLTGDFSHCMHFGYWLGRPFHGRGIATAACNALTQYAFERFGIIRLETKVFAPNVASIRVLEKCGFAREGYSPKGVNKDGQLYDLISYGKVRQ